MKPTGMPEKWRAWRKYLVLLGGIFVYLPIGVPWYFGNLATYIDSYFYARVEREADMLNPQWIFSAFLVMFTLAVPGSGYLVQWIGVKLTVLVALLVHSGATFLSYFAIQHSMHLLVLVFGAVGGLGAGLAYGPPLPVIVKWMPDNVGTASGVLLMGFGGGSIFYNELITAFVNPDNLEPDIKGGKTTYFSQEKILSRVPNVFIMLGALTVVLQAVGVALLRAPKEEELDSSKDCKIDLVGSTRRSSLPSAVLTTSCSIEVQHQQQGLEGSHHHHLQQQEEQESQQQQHLQHIIQEDCFQLHPPKQQQQQQQPLQQEDVVSAKPGLEISSSRTHSYQSTRRDSTVINPSYSPPPPDNDSPDYSPRQVLTSIHFHILWICLAANHYGYIIKNNFYKEFGQSKISDDHFLTMTGTLSTVAVALARLFWGWLADWLGVKTTLILFMATTTISTGFWYPSLFHSPFLYMIVVIIISFILSGAFIIFPLAALKMFGETHYPTNYGLILSAQIVVNLISPPINRALLVHTSSWFSLFCSIAVVNALGTVLSLFLKDYR